MCDNQYLGSSVKCREIPLTGDSLFVVPLSADGRSGRRGPIPSLTTEYQYFFGISGCGCGFAYYERNAPGRNIVEDRAHQQLAEYIASCLEHVESVEIYSCEDGDDNFHIKTRRQITLGQLKSPRFHFMPNELTTIYRDRAELQRHAKHRVGAVSHVSE